MFVLEPKFLQDKELDFLKELAARANFSDGSSTTGGMPDGHKRNLQFVPQGRDLETVIKLVAGAIDRTPRLRDSITMKRMTPPMISKYFDGMEYKRHLDSPFMNFKGALRTDLSMTLFLADPATYDGGELILETDFGEQKIKLDPGGVVIYSTRLYHRVAPVTRGERVAIVCWMQSFISDPAQRKVIGQTWQAYDDMVMAKGETSDEAARLMQVALELTRMWADG